MGYEYTTYIYDRNVVLHQLGETLRIRLHPTWLDAKCAYEAANRVGKYAEIYATTPDGRPQRRVLPLEG